MYKYFKKVPSAFPNPNVSLSGSVLSASANREMSELVRQDRSTTPGRYAFFLRNEKPFFLHRESILALRFRVLD